MNLGLVERIPKSPGMITSPTVCPSDDRRQRRTLFVEPNQTVPKTGHAHTNDWLTAPALFRAIGR
jgi:hypothetical protein